jgi:carboxypeptidase PM20D1
LKKLLLVFSGIVLTFFIILIVYTFRLGNTQIEASELLIDAEWDRTVMLERFSRAIQFKTISGDEETDRDTLEFYAFLKFLEDEFPLVHTRLELKMFNSLTPLYFWPGREPDLNPVMFMGHYDVVPVDSTDINNWVYSPFSGAIADGFIWGRGTIDNKFNVMALLETAEYLLANNFEPKRGIYFMFGHDEETGGNEGARIVSRYFQDNGIMLHYVLDEGGAVLDYGLFDDTPVAMVGVAEKGYLSLELIAGASGGHSSQPPADMAIVDLSEAIYKLVNNPFTARLDGAAELMFDSIADRLPFAFRVIYGNRWLTGRYMLNRLSSDETLSPMVQTTIAPTMLRAGVKDNVLPAEARAVINFRLLPGDSFNSVQEHVRSIIDNDKITIREYGSIKVPASIVSDVSGTPYRMIQQAVMDRFQDLYVVPYLVVGATDSRYFTQITNQVFRFAPMVLGEFEMGSFHGTNERISIDAFTGAIDFYAHLIRMSTE